MRLYFDTSVLVSLAVAHHPHHDLAYSAFRQVTAGGHEGFVSEVVCLVQKDYLAILEAAAKAGLRGGVVYDTLQLRCAEKARCDRIYTFNTLDFLRIAPHLRKQIVRP